MAKVRWGVLGVANIGVKRVIPAMQRGQHSQVVAIASRSLDRSRAAAQALGIERAYGSYEELLADPTVEAVYIPLPNHLHVPWSLKALEAGKHVLCEKPLAILAAEAQVLLEASRAHPRLKVMEAFMYRHHPQWQRARELVRNGALSELRTVQSLFTYHLTDPDNVRNRADIGGGGLLDIGCYCISWSRFLVGTEPKRVFATVEVDPVMKIDRLVSAVLDFDGATATFTCATQLAPYQRVQALGTSGRLEIEVPCNAPPDCSTRMWLERGQGVEEIVVAAADQYTIQGDLFSRAILRDTAVPTPLEDAVANLQAIDALRESGRRGEWVAIA